MIVYAISFLVGVSLGLFVALVIHNRRRFVGYLRIDHSDTENGPYIFLELTTNLSKLVDKRKVHLVVKQEDFLPHE